MKKNLFSDNRKGSKGFYAALGISAVMIGSACWFAYDQGNKLSQEFLAKNSVSEPERAVDRQVTNVPKSTTPYRNTVTTPVPTAPAYSVQEAQETPAAVIPEPAEPVDSAADEAAEFDPTELPLEPSVLNVGITKMENVKPPLADVSSILVPFSGTDLVKSETTGSWQTHNGTDIAAEEGAEVYAVSNGEIMSVEDDALWGITVVLDHHNGFITRYCGLASDVSVQEGDIVVSGNLIGKVGNTADIESAEDSHLHIEVTHHGKYVDPVDSFTQ